MAPLKFKNIEEALDVLNAKEHKDYYTCECPCCNKNEAFIYKAKPNFVNCNRENKCGETTVLVFEEELTNPNVKLKERSTDSRTLNSVQEEKLEWVTGFFNHFQNNMVNHALESEEGFRGLSYQTTQNFIANLGHSEVVAHMFKQINALTPEGKEYHKMSFMNKRNIVIPIRNEEGNIDALLLRSTLDPNADPKEIYLPLVPNPRMFVEDISDSADTIIISESVLDGLSFREIEPNASLIMLSGSKKTRQVEEMIKSNPEKFRGKKIIIAMDRDKAGLNAQRKIRTAFRSVGIRPTSFIYPKTEEKDPNDLLKKNRTLFEEYYKKTEKVVTRMTEHQENLTQQIARENFEAANNQGEKQMTKLEDVYTEEESAKVQEAVQESLNSAFSESEEVPVSNEVTEGAEVPKGEGNPFGVYIQNMTKLSENKAIADVRYGDVNLKNIFIENKDGVPLVKFPKEQGNDKEWRNVYTISGAHEKMIEAALIQNFTLLEHGIKQEVKNEMIPAKIHATEPKFDLRSKFGSEKSVGTVNYGALTIHNVWLNTNENGETKVSLPYKKNYETSKGELLRYVSGNKEFRNQILNSLQNQQNKTNEVSKSKEVEAAAPSEEKSVEKESPSTPSKTSLEDRMAGAKEKANTQIAAAAPAQETAR